MGVIALLGALPAPPPKISAATIRALRARDGSAPCEEGLAAGLSWIGDRELSFDDAIAEARTRISAEWFSWALDAIGYGNGNGYGDGYGNGYGYGYGDGGSR